MTKKILVFIFSFLLVGAFAFAITWGVINFNNVRDMMSGSGVYVQDDVNRAYEDGYNTALRDKDEYVELINNYRDSITTLNDSISQLNSQITVLRNNNRDYIDQVASLQISISENEATINLLNESIDSNLLLISSLNSEITDLSNEILLLQNTVTNNDVALLNDQNTITSLTSQVNNLLALKIQLEQTNQSNLNTISTLNAQIVTLNTQVSNLTLQIQNNSSSVSSLNNRISELESSISYYESYIASLQSATQVVATFMYDGSVYNIQVLNTNSYASVTAPTSTAYIVFNGWTVNGNTVNLASYAVSTNTTFVADLTYNYDVLFKVDNVTYDSQIVTRGSYATTPTAPTKNGYVFDGWTLDGTTIVNVTNTAITSNIIFVAKFTQAFDVTFTYESTTLSTQSIRNGGYATAPVVTDTTYKSFNSWKVNGTSVNVATYSITANTTFVADLTYKYDVLFKVDNVTYDSQIVTSGSYATIPTSPTKNGYAFDGWTLDGTTVINVLTNVISADTIFVAKFTELHTVNFISSGLIIDTQSVRNNSYVVLPNAPSLPNTTFTGWSDDGVDIVNIGNTPIIADTDFTAIFSADYCVGEIITVSGISNFDVQNVWSDNNNIYYSKSRTENYIFNPLTNTWSSIMFTGISSSSGSSVFSGKNIWSDGVNCYWVDRSLSNTYVFDGTNNTWSKITVTGSFGNFNASKVLLVNNVAYYLNGSTNYKFFPDLSRWQAVTSHPLSNFSNYTISDVWTDGVKSYCGNYIYNALTDSWNEIYIYDSDIFISPNRLTLVPGNVWGNSNNLYYYDAINDLIYTLYTPFVGA